MSLLSRACAARGVSEMRSCPLFWTLTPPRLQPPSKPWFPVAGGGHQLSTRSCRQGFRRPHRCRRRSPRPRASPRVPHRPTSLPIISVCFTHHSTPVSDPNTQTPQRSGRHPCGPARPMSCPPCLALPSTQTPPPLLVLVLPHLLLLLQALNLNLGPEP